MSLVVHADMCMQRTNAAAAAAAAAAGAAGGGGGAAAAGAAAGGGGAAGAATVAACFNISNRRYFVCSFPGQVCSFCNHLASRPVGQTMRESLKLKLKNALLNNITSHADASTPAVFVGGRRRNRKKRKTKNGNTVKSAYKEPAYKKLPVKRN